MTPRLSAVKRAECEGAVLCDPGRLFNEDNMMWPLCIIYINSDFIIFKENYDIYYSYKVYV